jgi:hypothetical protein
MKETFAVSSGKSEAQSAMYREHCKMNESSLVGSDPSKVSGARGLAREVGCGGADGRLVLLRRLEISSRRVTRQDCGTRLGVNTTSDSSDSSTGERGICIPVVGSSISGYWRAASSTEFAEVKGLCSPWEELDPPIMEPVGICGGASTGVGFKGWMGVPMGNCG